MVSMRCLACVLRRSNRAASGSSLHYNVGDGWAVSSATPGLRAYNPIGSVHAGYASTLLESACGCAVHAKLSAQRTYATLELKVAFQKAITVDTGRL
jgi:uncharacterized protein (TIGR00369 family)